MDTPFGAMEMDTPSSAMEMEDTPSGAMEMDTPSGAMEMDAPHSRPHAFSHSGCSSPVSRGRRKRSVSESSQPSDNKGAVVATPKILRHHVHRRRNVAASVWGVQGQEDTGTNDTSSAGNPPFNIYKALVRHPNLFFQFAIRLPYPTIVALYAIDKEFHYRFNKFSVGIIHDYARYHAPVSSLIFSWNRYPALCISDPMLRPMDGREWLARDVPGFRWVGMVLWREKLARGILTQLALEGLRVPRVALASLMKFWCVMEMKTTQKRQAFLADRNIWSNGELMGFQLFLVKLDMWFSDPVLGNGVCELSHMLLMQRDLRPLWKMLARRTNVGYDEVTEMAVRTYLGTDLDTDAQGWLDDELDNGVPEEEWGILSKEEWEVGGEKMEPALDMLIKECIKRRLNAQQYYLDFVLYGFVHPETRKNVPVPKQWRTDKGVTVPKDGWMGKEVRGKLIAGLDKLYGTQKLADGEERAMDTSS